PFVALHLSPVKIVGVEQGTRNYAGLVLQNSIAASMSHENNREDQHPDEYAGSEQRQNSTNCSRTHQAGPSNATKQRKCSKSRRFGPPRKRFRELDLLTHEFAAELMNPLQLI